MESVTDINTYAQGIIALNHTTQEVIIRLLLHGPTQIHVNKNFIPQMNTDVNKLKNIFICAYL